ncbi:MAG: protein translocase subunit SecD [Haloechinothrix sp.]
MAPPAGTIRPGRYLAFFLLIVVVLYSLVLFTGDGKLAPKLGIDLKGGTSVTLTARTPDGSEPTRESLDQARAIIDERVNGLGVSGAEVVLDGQQIRITVPGEEGEQAKSLGQTAKLYFRQVIGEPIPVGPAPGQQDGGQPGGEPPAENEGGGSSTSGGARTQTDAPVVDEERKKEIADAKKLRQNPALLEQGPEAQQALQAAVAGMDCSPGALDPLRGNDDPELPLVACSQDRDDPEVPPFAYLLGPSILDGQAISDASAGRSQDGPGHQVNLNFTSSGVGEWAKITSQNVGQSVAFVLDTEVVSAPRIEGAIAGGSTRITGDFTQDEAQHLAEALKYGSLPLSFESSDATTVSATLGLASLKAGLIAGAIGFALIVLYSIAYYRLLGVLLIASLILTAGLVYPVIILLGRSVGFTLDLAGVAGLIIAIGVTADSFVVYFERLKDEIRTGRTVRSAIPRAWVRGRRTILSADAVVLLAAVVLYVLAIGQVKGFAFTVGLSTTLDLVVVFLVTHPLMVLAGGWHILNNRALSGLGLVQDAGAAVQRTRKARAATAKGA